MSGLQNQKQIGFTIVELLIVIVVIAILAAITVVSYNGIQTRANNTMAVREVAQWTKIFETYKAQEGSYPVMNDGGYCLGKDFPIGGGGVRRCRDYEGTGVSAYLESGNTVLMDELNKAATASAGNKVPVSGTVGPYAEYTSTTISVITILRGSSSDVCEPPTKYSWTDGSTRVICRVLLYR